MAVSVDYAPCPSCSKENPKTPSVTHCRGCNALLPWSKGATNSSASSSSPKMGLGDIAWAAMSVQILGGIVFLAGCFFFAGNLLGFFPTFPGLGYITLTIGGAVWGYGANMD